MICITNFYRIFFKKSGTEKCLSYSKMIRKNIYLLKKIKNYENLPLLIKTTYEVRNLRFRIKPKWSLIVKRKIYESCLR